MLTSRVARLWANSRKGLYSKSKIPSWVWMMISSKFGRFVPLNFQTWNNHLEPTSITCQPKILQPNWPIFSCTTTMLWMVPYCRADFPTQIWGRFTLSRRFRMVVIQSSVFFLSSSRSLFIPQLYTVLPPIDSSTCWLASVTSFDDRHFCVLVVLTT